MCITHLLHMGNIWYCKMFTVDSENNETLTPVRCMVSMAYSLLKVLSVVVSFHGNIKHLSVIPSKTGLKE